MVELLTPLALIFIVSVPPLMVAKRIGIPSIPVYIIVGLLIAPFIGRGQTLDLAQLGIAFLVFVFGVYVEPERISTVARDSEHVAAIQLVVVGALAMGIGLGLGIGTLNAVYVGIAATLGSSLVGRELLDEDIHLNLVYGRLTQSIHFVQDLFAVSFVLLLSATAFEFDAIALNLGYGVMILVGAVLVRVYLFDLLARLSGSSDELIILTGIGILVAFITVTELLGISIVVGAFAAGLAIKLEFVNNLALLNGLESLEDFFAAIFFVTLGSLVTTPTIETLLTALVIFGCIVVLKPLVTIFELVRRGYETRTATLTSFGLDQVSEFSLIVAIQALLLGRIDDTIFDAIVLAAAATMITSTVTRQHDDRLYRWLDAHRLFESTHRRMRERSTVPPDIADHVIVIGYGKLGIKVARTCERLGQPFVVIEHDPEPFQIASDECDNYVFGDAIADVTLNEAKVSKARLIISTTPDRRVAAYLLSERPNTDADVFLRGRTADEAVDLYEAGADYVIIPDYLASAALEAMMKAIFAGETPPERIRQAELRFLRQAMGVGLPR